MSDAPNPRTTSLSPLDKALDQLSQALKVTASRASAARPTPASECREVELSEAEKKHAAGLMRVNHSGEVCAQALYQGQALTAKLPEVRREMERAAAEEIDHLAWCEERVKQLGGQTSLLNPLWYGMSFGIGALAGLVSDRLSLGFVSATEDQVCKHLDSHLESLPPKDSKSRAIVRQMLEEEAKHSHTALQAGGLPFPEPVKKLMTVVSGVMTKSSYRI